MTNNQPTAYFNDSGDASTKAAAVVKQLVNNAIKGNGKSTTHVLEHLEKIEPESKVAEALNDDDRKILDNFFKQQTEQNDE